MPDVTNEQRIDALKRTITSSVLVRSWGKFRENEAVYLVSLINAFWLKGMRAGLLEPKDIMTPEDPPMVEALLVHLREKHGQQFADLEKAADHAIETGEGPVLSYFSARLKGSYNDKDLRRAYDLLRNAGCHGVTTIGVRGIRVELVLDGTWREQYLRYDREGYRQIEAFVQEIIEKGDIKGIAHHVW